MLVGKAFRLSKESLAIDGRKAFMIPAGQVVKVVRAPRIDDKRMVDVTWEARALIMFLADIEERGEEVSPRAG